MFRSGSGDSRYIPVYAAAACALAGALVYLNSLGNGFAFDDEFVIVTRQVVHSLGDVPALLGSPYWPAEFDAGLYRPLTLLTYAIDWAIWNGDAFGFHLVNVLLHAAVSFLVAAFLLRFFEWWAALAGGLVFAVHPVHTEAVANVVGRAELLAALFALGACIVYVRAVRGTGLTPQAIAAILAFYTLASFSKEAGIVLPGLLLATDIPLLGGRRPLPVKPYLRSRLPLLVALTVVLLAVFAVRFVTLGTPLEHQPDPAFALDDSFSTRLLTMTRVWPRYFELLLFPLHLSADYSPAVILPVDRLTPLSALGILLLFGVVAATLLTLRRAPQLGVAVVWAAIALLPVSNLIVMAQLVLAERTLYLPSVAVSIVAALALSRLARRWRPAIAAVVLAWVVAFSVVTVRRNPVWESTNTVFEDLRRHHPESSRLLFGLGNWQYRQGDWPAAREWFRRSLQVWPHHAIRRRVFGWYLYGHGELAEAEGMATAAVQLSPDNPRSWDLLAHVQLKAGRPRDAIESARRGLAEAGDDARLFAVLAAAYRATGQFDRAVEARQRAVEITVPDLRFDALLLLAAAQMAAGDSVAAEATLRDAGGTAGARGEALDSLRRSWSDSGSVAPPVPGG